MIDLERCFGNDCIQIWKTSAVSTTDGWWKVNFASCVIRQTRWSGVLLLCSNSDMVFVNDAHDMLVDTRFRKFYGGPFARVLYIFLTNDIGRWLPWGLPGSTGRFYKNDVVHNHSAHGYYITRMEARVICAWYCCYILNRIKENWPTPAIYIKW